MTDRVKVHGKLCHGNLAVKGFSLELHSVENIRVALAARGARSAAIELSKFLFCAFVTESLDKETVVL
jgi:hypothetical protein